MNVSSLQIQKSVPVTEASNAIPSITIISTPASIGKRSYLRNSLLNPTRQSQSNAQIPSETMQLNKQPMLNMDMVSEEHDRESQKHGTSESKISKVG
ncbi:hypothetical protein O181_081779 [Austropuccinia psidii MF-1]|uniref:Uncharacterized protein n=1 Tax=Austropuccinia psidii MF-1 TaxID=1389203 RepID=A0A9Q3IKF5_9BASI|nr:hypothetical protein [Austropuccinia psidii MF-1]